MSSHSIGMPIGQNRVELRDPDPAWPSAYERERRLVEATLAPLGLTRVEHVGSTAVAGIRAKPVIDMMVGIEAYDRFDEHRARLGAIGYAYDPDAERDDPGRRVFRKARAGAPRLRTHHLHLTLVDSVYWIRILAFRDYLRINRQAAREYEGLKMRLADDPHNYTRNKGEFVRRVEALALRERA